MRQVYTNESYVLAMNSKNRLEAGGIQVELRNEYASGAAVGGHAIWPELWVSEADYDEATSILEASPDDGELADWVCQYCKQTVPGNFSVCWKCQVGAG